MALVLLSIMMYFDKETGLDAVSQFFHGMELITPGVVPVLGWRPDPQDTLGVDHRSVPYRAGVGRKP